MNGSSNGTTPSEEPAPPPDPIEIFRRDLASFRERVGGNLRMAFEEDLQRFSNRRFHLLVDFHADKRRIEDIVTEHQKLAPQLRLRVLTGG